LLVAELPANGRSKGSPDAPIAWILPQHPLRMELESNQKGRLRIVIAFNQTVLRIRHWLEPISQTPNPLVMVAIDPDRLPAIPVTQRSTGQEPDEMTVSVVVVRISVLDP
jgi:hypothetical protein